MKTNLGGRFSKYSQIFTFFILLDVLAILPLITRQKSFVWQERKWFEEFRFKLLFYHCSHYHLSGALSMLLLKKTFFIFCLTLRPQSTVNITVFCLQNKYFSPHFPPSDAKILSYVFWFYSTNKISHQTFTPTLIAET